MAGIVQSPADGLLALMSLKVQGNMPSDFLDAVRPILDIEQYYLRSQASRVEVNTAAALAAGTIGLVSVPGISAVPDGFVRWIHRATVYTAVEAGQSLQLAPAFIDLTAGVQRDLIVGEPLLVTAPAAATAVVLPRSIENVWLTPGMRLCMAVDVNTNAAAAQVTGFMRFVDILR